jgi:hypothetical protein
MAIFSRRTLQRLLNENASFLRRRQLRNHVDKLNKGDISAEWEVVLLNIFSKLGKVEHERKFNGKNPDIYFTSDDHALDFLADIKTVSDEGIELKNPQRELYERLHKEIKERDIKGAWNLQIGGNDEEARKTGAMIQLKLPPLARFNQEIFNEKWEEFTSQIRSEPNREHRYVIKDGRTDLVISYKPSAEWYSTGGYPSYKSITSREHLIQNSIWNGLVAKSEQLIDSGYEGTLGIILCDGGSEYLRRSRTIIHEFFRTHPRINFVLGFEAIQNFGHDSSNQVMFYFEKGEGLSAELEDFLSNLHTHSDIFPYPVKSAINALNALKSTKPHLVGSFYGGSTMSGYEIKVSSRTILDLLAGRITYDEFPEDYRDYFKRRVSEGRLFEGIEIERGENEKDDDWLIFRFGEPDPAISPFTVPKEAKP